MSDQPWEELDMDKPDGAWPDEESHRTMRGVFWALVAEIVLAVAGLVVWVLWT